MVYGAYMEEIRKWEAEKGLDLQPPASEQEILELRRSAVAELGSDIPDGYAHFLRIINGLQFNGLCIYATRRTVVDVGTYQYTLGGFVDETLVWRSMADEGADLLVFGEGNIDIYVYNPANSRFE